MYFYFLIGKLKLVPDCSKYVYLNKDPDSFAGMNDAENFRVVKVYLCYDFTKLLCY